MSGFDTNLGHLSPAVTVGECMAGLRCSCKSLVPRASAKRENRGPGFLRWAPARLALQAVRETPNTNSPAAFRHGVTSAAPKKGARDAANFRSARSPAKIKKQEKSSAWVPVIRRRPARGCFRLAPQDPRRSYRSILRCGPERTERDSTLARRPQ